MCFGDTKTQTSTQNSTTAPPAWLSDAANSNVQFAQGVQKAGFTPYSGQQVASFAPQQQQSFDLGGQITGGVSPFVGQTGGMVDKYATAGPQSVSADSIASQMTPYMSQYVKQSLAPQLDAQDQQFAQQNKSWDAGATGAGAFGDTSWALGKGNLTNQQDAARAGLVGNAYNTAFNTAIGAGAQDVANNLNASTTNANLAETALGRQLTGANTLYSMGTGADQLQNTLGGQQTAATQADLNAKYNQWQMAQQYPFQTTQLMDQAITAGRAGAPITTDGTSTQSSPDNSGFGILGSIGGSLLSSPAAGSAATAALAFLADGGPSANGQPTVVGERGPELIVPDGNGVVIPNEVLQAAAMLRAVKPGNGQVDKGAALDEALQKPVRFMADGGFFGDLFGGGTGGFMSGAPSLDTGNSAPWINPDGAAAPGEVGSTLNGTGTPRVFASPQDQTMLNADVPMSPDRANAIYDAYKRVGGGTDVSASAKANDPLAAIPAKTGTANWAALAKTLGDSKTWAPLNAVPGGPVAPRAPQAPQAQGRMPMPAMQPLSLPGGGNSAIPMAPPPRNLTTAPGAPPMMQFGIAA